MKKLYAMMSLLLLFAVAACTPEEDDLFNQSASERIDEAIAQDLEVLRGAENGWALEYYPSMTQMYGGYTILLKFHEDGKVDVSCDFFDADKVVTSDYQVKQSMGPMLTFDTYNEIFHFFSSPSNEYGFGEAGKGMEGDYEFTILECTPDKVVLKGKKTSNTMVMTPVPTEDTWVGYLTKLKDVAATSYPPTYDVKVNGTLQYAVSRKYRVFALSNADGSSENLPFIYTPDGVRFYEPVTIGGETVQNLKWDAANLSFESEDGTKVVLEAQELPANYAAYSELVGTYVMVTGQGQAVVQLEEAAFNTCYTMKGLGFDLRVMYEEAVGGLSLQVQELSDGCTLCAWDGYSGYLTNMPGVGMVGSVISKQPLTIQFADNGEWGSYETNSFIGYDTATGADNGFQIPLLQGLVKIN